MSVNIFGGSTRAQATGATGQRGVPGVGFKILDSNGNYDMLRKRLANVSHPPSDIHDAVTKDYVDGVVDIMMSDLASDILYNSNRVLELEGSIQNVRSVVEIELPEKLIEYNGTMTERTDSKLQEVRDHVKTTTEKVQQLVTGLEEQVTLNNDQVTWLMDENEKLRKKNRR